MAIGLSTAEHVAEHVAEEREAQKGIKSFLKSEGIHASNKAIAKTAVKAGKVFTAAEIGSAALTAFFAYHACMAQ